jgi:hypothetical protein
MLVDDFEENAEATGKMKTPRLGIRRGVKLSAT